MQKTLVRKFSSKDHSSEELSSPKYQPLPVAERWFAKPQILEKGRGMHRFVWNLTWATSGGPSADEEAEYHNPSGPKAIPGVYEVRLIVDGKTQSQPLNIIMDPRSPATPEILVQQLQLGRQIFGETTAARRAQAEIDGVQQQLAEIQKKLEQDKPNPSLESLKASLTRAQSSLDKILRNKSAQQGDGPGLQDAYTALASSLRVVESGDRAVSSQAIAVYKESSPQVKARIAEWAKFKETELNELNQQLLASKLTPISISAIERLVELSISR